jgi:menaquinone-dependent protoporphyrinogen oxidase
MKALIVFASRHRATAEIAEAIGAALIDRGIDTDVLPVASLVDIGQYDAVIIGSAVYAGHVLSETRAFVDQNEALLRERPVWVFSSGPLSDLSSPKDEASQAVEIAEQLGARGHRVFAGKLERSDLNVVERVVTLVVGAKPGDYRDWQEVIDWGIEIAEALNATRGLSKTA